MKMAAKRKIEAALWDTPYCPKIPCKHACAAIGSNNDTVSQYVSAFYNIEVYRAAYETNIQPIPTFDMPDLPQPSNVLIKPLTIKNLPGRPRKRRSRACVYLFKVQTNMSQQNNL
ncbi:hypothetical protein Taro_038096 [Colocasia esculenta]|uniref:Uncharacterized protein n=1 Tax=Colocasia esculenta TaxID=4460 RepID=A0A843W5T2_COLES|nr:hypothetical protein [Colocasia esculenta]